MYRSGLDHLILCGIRQAEFIDSGAIAMPMPPRCLRELEPSNNLSA